MSAATVTVSPTIRLTGNRPASSSGETHSIVIRWDLRLAMAGRTAARSVLSGQCSVLSAQCSVGSAQGSGLWALPAGNRTNAAHRLRRFDRQLVRDPANGQQVAAGGPDQGCI